MTIENENVRGLGCFIYSKGLENLFAHVNKKQEINRKLLAYKLLHRVMKYRDNMGQCHVLQSVWLSIYTLNWLVIFNTCKYFTYRETYIILIKYIFTWVAFWKYDYLLWCLDHVTWGLVWNILIIRIQKHDRTRNERFCMTRKYKTNFITDSHFTTTFCYTSHCYSRKAVFNVRVVSQMFLTSSMFPDNVFIDT